jgi:proteasome lid subunit RPN8/RPN11
MAFRLQVPESVRDAMVAQALAEQPNECCGMLAGVLELPDVRHRLIGRVVTRYPLVNALASPRRYEAQPRGLFDAHKGMRKAGLELLAIYHSHPTTEPVPSRTDLENNGYDDTVVHLIISLAVMPPLIRAWRLTSVDYREEEWDVIGGAVGSQGGGPC